MPAPRFVSVLAVLLAAAAGCASRSRPAPLPHTPALFQLGPVDTAAHVSEADLFRGYADESRTAFATPVAGCRQNFLALSGGGMFGAYTVGVLNGWTAAGTRPTFDVVTGVSTGALIATYAFLGPGYDAKLEEAYTTITTRDVYRRRRGLQPLLNESAADSAPLRRMIAEQVDDQVLAEVARAHRAGRRLYVGTTNLDTRRPVIWDMGAIAAGGRPDALELYRTILLASASPPGFFPPVPIPVTVNGRRMTELHIDGGATAAVFLRATAPPSDRPPPPDAKVLAGSDAYVIVAGKLYSDPKATERRTVKVAEGGLESVLYAQTRGDLNRIYVQSLLGGMRFHLAAVPADAEVPADSMGFDPEAMRKLYRLGYAAASGGSAWRDTPPGTRPEEQVRPRTGPDFYAPER